MSEHLSLPELAAWIGEHHTRDLFRFEPMPFYASASDGDDFARFLAGETGPNVDKSGWRNTLATARAEGRAWRRLRVIHAPMTDYERYSCAWGYPDNVAWGETVKVLPVNHGDRTHERIGDFFVVDDEHVARSYYGDDGAFTHARIVEGEEADVLIGLRDLLWNPYSGQAQLFEHWGVQYVAERNQREHNLRYGAA